MALLAQNTTGCEQAYTHTHTQHTRMQICLSFRVPTAPAEASQQELLFSYSGCSSVLTGVTKKGKCEDSLREIVFNITISKNRQTVLCTLCISPPQILFL